MGVEEKRERRVIPAPDWCSQTAQVLVDMQHRRSPDLGDMTLTSLQPSQSDPHRPHHQALKVLEQS